MSDSNSIRKNDRRFTRTSWDGQFQELLEFKTKHNHCTVPANDEKYTKLYGWIQHQKAEKKKKAAGKTSRLTDERERRLDEIGFVWSIQDNIWNQRLNELRAFKSKYGHVRVPTKDGKKLGTWVMIQRLQYQKNALTSERIEALEEVGFEWDIHEVSWEEKYNRLKVFMSNGDETTSDPRRNLDPTLKSWIAAQRAEKRYKQRYLQSHLTDEREAKLDQIGFDWKVDDDRNERRSANWLHNFEMLKEYKNKHDTCRVPVRKGCMKDEKSFAHWVRDQRRYYKAFVKGLDAPMTKERRNLLESIGFADDIVI